MADTNANNSNLIYGSDDDTTILIRLADNEIKNGKYEKAIELLQYGINKYPNYPTSYFLYGKALLTLGKVKEAKEAFQVGIDLIGFKDTAEYYTSLIPEIQEITNSESVGEIKQKEEVVTRIDEVESDTVKSNDNKISEEPVVPPTEKEDVNLEELANKLSNAKIDMPRDHDAPVQPQKETEPRPSYSPRDLVSETLARIYVSQENYKEAIEIYETLIEIQPERKDYYLKKLEEIEVKRSHRS